MKKQFLEVGKIINTHGIKGELKMQLWCDGIDVLKAMKAVYLDAEGNKAIILQSVRQQKDCALIVLEGVESLEQAVLLKNQVLYMNRSDMPLKQGQWFIQDLIGCKVIDLDTKELYGAVTDITNLGASDLYTLLTPANEEVLIPAIPDVVRHVDIEAGVIEIKKMKGLFSDAD